MFSKRFALATGLEKSFYRNSDSGSFWGGKNAKKVTTHDLDKACFGDIVCPPNFVYSLECKHYKTAPSFASIMNGEINDWDQWITQALQDSLNSDKRMAIIVKYNNTKEIVILAEPVIVPVMYYKAYFVVSLEAFLARLDHEFFTVV